VAALEGKRHGENNVECRTPMSKSTESEVCFFLSTCDIRRSAFDIAFDFLLVHLELKDAGQ